MARGAVQRVVAGSARERVAPVPAEDAVAGAVAGSAFIRDVANGDGERSGDRRSGAVGHLYGDAVRGRLLVVETNPVRDLELAGGCIDCEAATGIVGEREAVAIACRVIGGERPDHLAEAAVLVHDVLVDTDPRGRRVRQVLCGDRAVLEREDLHVENRVGAVATGAALVLEDEEPSPMALDRVVGPVG